MGGYFGVGWAVDPSRARSLATAWDRAIPFVPWTIYVYLAVFPAAFLPVFTVRSRALFRRTIAAYVLAIAVSLAIFAAFPVTSGRLRADLAGIDPDRFTGWCLRLVYGVDPPVNLFPSLHLSIAALAATSLGKARRAYGSAAWLLVAAIGVSICTVKQHFLVDGLGGLALALVLHALLVRPFRPAPSEGSAAYPAAGPILYLVFQGAVYLGLYVAFRMR